MVGAGPPEILVMSFAGEGLPDGAGAALELIQRELIRNEGDARIVEAFPAFCELGGRVLASPRLPMANP